VKKLLLVLVYLLPFFTFIYEGCVPSKPTEQVEILPSERLTKKLEANRRKIKNFEGTGTIEINTPEVNTTASFKVVMQRPDSVYLEVYGPFGIELAQALVTSNNFSFYDAMHNTLYKGNSNSDILKKIFKVDMSFSDLTDAFVGAVNLTQKLTQNPSNYEIVYDKYVLTYSDSLTQAKTKYTVDIRDLVVTNYQLFGTTDNLILQGSYSKFKIVNGIPVPFLTEIKNKSENQNLKIEYRKVDVNKRNSKITFDIPEDAEVVKW
jgi:outer membrane lipoprotein-sorting protein